METILTESDLLSGTTSKVLEGIRAQAPAGEDPVSVAMVQACAAVDGVCLDRQVPGNLKTAWATALAVYTLAKLLTKPTDAQKTAYDDAIKSLESIREGKCPWQRIGGSMSYGSNRKL